MNDKDIKELKDVLVDIKKLLLTQCLADGQPQDVMAKILGTSQASISRLAPGVKKNGEKTE
jgi:DNA-directed RNA polymerase specialized sigma subunit